MGVPNQPAGMVCDDVDFKKVEMCVGRKMTVVIPGAGVSRELPGEVTEIYTYAERHEVHITVPWEGPWPGGSKRTLILMTRKCGGK